MTERGAVRERRHIVRREQDRRGPAAGRTEVDVQTGEGARSFFLHDRVSWGSIWGGFLTAMGTFILLSLLATAIGLTTVEAGAAQAETLNRWAGVASAVIGLISFFVGGYVAGLMGGFVTPASGMMNGFLVWALANVVMLALAAFGLGQLFGAAGELYDEFTAMSAGVNIERQQVVEGLQSSAWIAFIAMALAAFAAAAGGLLGTMSRGPAPAVDEDVHD